MRFQTPQGQACLTAKQVADILNDPRRAKLGMTETQWKKYCLRFGAKPMLGQYQEVEEPSFSGRSRFCRPALEILKRLILSGDTPTQAYEKEVARLQENTNPVKGLVKDDLKFLLQMGTTWEGIYIPNQKLDALARSTNDPHVAIRHLIGSQNDPIVRHRLTLFAERLEFLSVTKNLGTPDYVVLEFVREDFMGKKAKFEYFKFQRDRRQERAKAREEAAKAGAEERSAGFKMELLKSQVGECLYTNAKLIPEKLDEYVIDHIVPRAKGGPDAAVNYILTTQRANDEKGDRTPYEWLASKDGWDAYVERVKKRIGTLRNKKVQLLTSPDAETLVEKYTALAETAWISKLAQTIVGLRFGWVNGNDREGKKRVIVVSGGLTGRIRRKYKLNSLLNPDAKDEEEAETKNRNDDRHHALDAMVISFIPNWARNAKSTGFFRFPEGVHRELFGREIALVKPRNMAIEKPIFEETIYGQRSLAGHKFIVGRESLSGFAIKLVQNQETLKKRSDIDTHRIVDTRIRRDVENFWEANPAPLLATWKQWCSNYRVGVTGPRVESVLVTKSKADSVEEYKNIDKVGPSSKRGQFKRGAKHRGYFIYDRPAPTRKEPAKMQVEVRPVFVFESRRAVQEDLARDTEWKICGYFESGCQVRTQREWEFQGKKYPADEYILGSVWANRNAKLWHPIHQEVGPVGLRLLLDAGFERI
jgi:CRISPR-associated endonuclease Csn1